jgi:uncharacterized protein (TIGR03790 family)
MVIEDAAARVVIVANAREPESVALAAFYAEQRGIPAANIIALPMPQADTVTWREFVDQIQLPLQDKLVGQGWIGGLPTTLADALGRRRRSITGHRISYLVVCRGVPWRIWHDPTLPPERGARVPAPDFATNQAAVDSELSLLAQSNTPVTGYVSNPLLARDRTSALEEEMVVKVSRLDGPTWEDARQLVRSALAGERDGLTGRYYIDFKGLHSDGDRWLESVQSQLRALGFDGDSETTTGTFTTDARFDEPVLYFGWYAPDANGPFLRDGFRFPPGAIAVHIHSFSAANLHSATQGWCGPLVARGVTATVGNVFEPYLQLTHRPNLLVQALARGMTFGDAVYYALPALSWQCLAIGDPLYRPFARKGAKE